MPRKCIACRQPMWFQEEYYSKGVHKSCKEYVDEARRKRSIEAIEELRTRVAAAAAATAIAATRTSEERQTNDRECQATEIDSDSSRCEEDCEDSDDQPLAKKLKQQGQQGVSGKRVRTNRGTWPRPKLKQQRQQGGSAKRVRTSQGTWPKPKRRRTLTTALERKQNFPVANLDHGCGGAHSSS